MVMVHFEFEFTTFHSSLRVPVKQKKRHGFTPVKQKKVLVSQGKLDKN
jgi:hypothetical protein